MDPTSGQHFLASGQIWQLSGPDLRTAHLRRSGPDSDLASLEPESGNLAKTCQTAVGPDSGQNPARSGNLPESPKSGLLAKSPDFGESGDFRIRHDSDESGSRMPYGELMSELMCTMGVKIAIRHSYAQHVRDMLGTCTHVRRVNGILVHAYIIHLCCTF